MLTIGHSTKPLEAFVDLCRAAKVELVCDVRRFPWSRRHPQFSRERLEQDLPRHGIAYVWLGDGLGGMREGGYDAWMQTGDFARGLQELERLALKQTLAFMCAEGLPWKCHRRSDAPPAPPPAGADALASRGHRIVHLLPGGELVSAQRQLELPDR